MVEDITHDEQDNVEKQISQVKMDKEGKPAAKAVKVHDKKIHNIFGMIKSLPSYLIIGWKKQISLETKSQ